MYAGHFSVYIDTTYILGDIHKNVIFISTWAGKYISYTLRLNSFCVCLPNGSKRGGQWDEFVEKGKGAWSGCLTGLHCSGTWQEMSLQLLGGCEIGHNSMSRADPFHAKWGPKIPNRPH